MSETLTEINEQLKLIQDTRGLTFGSDAYLLAAFAKGGRSLRAADLGSGTGIIPMLCLSKNKFEKMFAVELQKGYAEIIQKNAELNALDHRLVSICADVRSISSANTEGELDAVTANPPYMKADSGKRNENDEKYLARHEVYGSIMDFCACARRLLKHGGKFYTVWRPDRLTDLIVALRENKLEPKQITFVCAYPGAAPSMVLIRSQKGGASGSAVTRNLFLHLSREDAVSNILSPDAAAIYESCSFDNFK